MEVILDRKSLVGGKTLEGFILSNLVEGDLLNSAPRDDLAIRINLINNMSQSIELSDAVARDLDLSVQILVDIHKLRNTSSRNNGFVKLSGEYGLHLIKERPAGAAQWSWKLREFHALGGAPEVALLSEVDLSEVVNTKGNVIISRATLDFAPEKKLFEIHFGLELPQGKTDVHLLINIEHYPVWSEVFQLLVHLLEIHLF